jgi:heme/copper-type cytochrome/quinol oxidase subunit 3
MTQRDYFNDKLTFKEREQRRIEREAKQALDNKRLGVLVFQISWIMAFLCLVMVNWQLRFQYESWPPPNVEAMGVLLPTIATLLLLVGVVTARQARQAVYADDLPRFAQLWTVTLVTGVGFVLIAAYEWWHVGVVDAQDTQYQSVFRLMTGFHMLHALVIGGMIANVLVNVRAYLRHPDAEGTVRYGSDNFWMVEATSKLWDFVFVAWLIFYVVLYWWRSG